MRRHRHRIQATCRLSRCQLQKVGAWKEGRRKLKIPEDTDIPDAPQSVGLPNTCGQKKHRLDNSLSGARRARKRGYPSDPDLGAGLRVGRLYFVPGGPSGRALAVIDLDGPRFAGQLNDGGQGYPRTRFGHGVLPWLWRAPCLDRPEGLVAGDQSLKNHESHIKTLAAAKCNEQKVPKFGGKGKPTMAPIYGKNTVYFQ